MSDKMVLVSSMVLAPLAALAANASSPAAALAAKPARDSTYTRIASDSCRVVSVDDETGDTVEECQGLLDRNGRGYRVFVETYDAREGIYLTTPDSSRIDLDIVSAGAGAFNTLPSDVIEWRGPLGPNGKVVPDTLIVRSRRTHPDQSQDSFLLVYKVSAFRACLVEKIDAAHPRGANAIARAISDAQVPAFPCSPSGDR